MIFDVLFLLFRNTEKKELLQLVSIESALFVCLSSLLSAGKETQ